MEKIGTIRRIDELGRIVIPKLIRNKMRLKEGDRVVVSYNIEDDTVIVEFGNNKNCRIPMQKAAIADVEKAGSAE